MVDLTLRRVFDDYKALRDLKPKTLQNYEYRLTHCFYDWLDTDVRDITRQMVMVRHREIQGKAMANSAMRTLKALYNFAEARYELDGKSLVESNPTSRLTAVRAWNRDRVRTNVLQGTELAAWWRAVQAIDDTSVRDFFIVVLFTGARKSEILNLKWVDVNLEHRVIHFRDTKTVARDVPYSTFVSSLLDGRAYSAEGEYVFDEPGGKRVSQTKIEEYKRVAWKLTGKRWTVHDLRRSYATHADFLEERPEPVMELVGHKNRSMTERYTIRSIERLRRTAHRISDSLLQFCTGQTKLTQLEQNSDVIEVEYADTEQSIRKLLQFKEIKPRHSVSQTLGIDPFAAVE
ncbi:MAG TPA: site-specific integrase [Drouetiella sp.]